MMEAEGNENTMSRSDGTSRVIARWDQKMEKYHVQGKFRSDATFNVHCSTKTKQGSHRQGPPSRAMVAGHLFQRSSAEGFSRSMSRFREMGRKACRAEMHRGEEELTNVFDLQPSVASMIAAVAAHNPQVEAAFTAFSHKVVATDNHHNHLQPRQNSTTRSTAPHLLGLLPVHPSPLAS